LRSALGTGRLLNRLGLRFPQKRFSLIN
jgi:hypothetical protein